MSARSWGQQAFKGGKKGIKCRLMGKEHTAREKMELGGGWSILLGATLLVSR